MATSPALIQQLQTPRAHVSAPEFAEYGDVHFGFGFRTHWYRGERVVWHSGGLIGWSTLMTMLPDRGLGVAVFTNRNPNSVTEIVANHVFDRVCGKDPIPGSVVFVNGAAKPWPRSRSTDRPGKRCGG
jgi:CubicO group peptidase (beta-lactamase class C family)